ncbi:CO dehydrogenase accessory protein CooC (nickel insertion) [Lachnospiraceae bacterium TWA4]|nr:CO dehydrogenase accessory protein CooC (nickel insertion) [Lachnospiraceae bacterium TWA4]
MKISVCGKGGCGKSTVITLLGKALVASGKEVLIIDSDESNYGLHRHLGMENPKDFTEYFGGKEKAQNDLMLSKFTHQFIKDRWTIRDIPNGYYTEKDGMKLMVSGKIKQANEGCACTMGTIIKDFVTHLDLTENQFALLDMEAGIEHFGRGIDDAADVVLMVCDPSYESVQLAQKIKELGTALNKPVYYILNKVEDDTKDFLHEAIKDQEAIIAEIPATPDLLRASLKGESLQGNFKQLDGVVQKLTA